MKRISHGKIVATMIAIGISSNLCAATENAVTATPEELKWTATQALPPGAEVTVLSGNPAKKGWRTHAYGAGRTCR